MKTVLQTLIHSFEIDRMQSSYTKEQMIELLSSKLEEEKQQIVNAYDVGSDNGYKLGLIAEFEEHATTTTAEQYYYSISEIIL